MNKRIIIVLIIALIIPVINFMMNSDQQVPEEPAGSQIQKENEDKVNSEQEKDRVSTETALEEDGKIEIAQEEDLDYNEENEDNTEYKEEYTTSEKPVEIKEEEEEVNQEKNNEEESQVEDSTDNTTSEEGINYTSETGISIEGEIDFDMDLKEEISSEDKIEAIKYAAKLDIPYLLKLISDGITDEDKALVAEHMRDKLTEEEYDKTKNLIVKYLFLLQ